jgi:hypothetical protein
MHTPQHIGDTIAKAAPKRPAKFVKSVEYDEANSTFRWEMPHIDNPQHVTHGFSKSKDYPEIKDNMKLFMGFIERVWFRADWKSKAIEMRIYQRNGPVRKDHPLYVTLRARSFELAPCMIGFASFGNWLTSLYNTPIVVAASGPETIFNPEAMERIYAKQVEAAQLFNPRLAVDPVAQIDAFPNGYQLINYCSTLINTGRLPRGVVEQYYRDMCKKFPDYVVNQ